MFVWGFLLGFFLAFIVNLFWVRQLKSASSFGEFMGKGSAGEKYRDTVIDLEIEVEQLQEQLQRMEEHISYGPSNGEARSGDLLTSSSPVMRPGPTRLREFPGEDLFIGTSNKKIQKQGEVLSLWEKGKNVSEIAKDTGLGQGEVELILSLRNKLHRLDLEDEAGFEEKKGMVSG